ncbi:MAG: RNA polymerase sigma factor, partial [Candidatus Limnocylindrales bacterium]
MQRQLVERAIGGDFDAFTDLVNASASRQHAIAALILRDPDRAHDAVQDALVAAWRGLSALRDPDAWEVWLHRLTVRACYSRARQDKRRSLVELPASADFEMSGGRDEPAAFAERDRIERELGALPIDQRAVIVLHFYVGLPLTEAATVLGVPAGTAKSRLHRGLQALRL